MGRTPRPLEGRLFLREDNLEQGAETVLAASRSLLRDVRPLLEDDGLNLTEFDVLMEIKRLDRVDVTTLRERLGAAKPTLARVLGDLSRDGLIHRIKDLHDGRRRNLSLSDKGHEKLARVVHRLRESVARAYRSAGEPQVTGAMVLLNAIIGDDTPAP